MKLSAFIPLIIFTILITALAPYLINKPAEAPTTSKSNKTQTIVTEVPITNKTIGKKLPYLSLPNLLDIKSPLRNDDLKERNTIVNFFASWCVPCHREHKYLMEIKDKIDIYGIAWQDPYPQTTNFIKNKGNPYKKIGMDLDGRFSIDIGLSGAPETLVIDHNGIILVHHKGELTKEVIEKNIQPHF